MEITMRELITNPPDEEIREPSKEVTSEAEESFLWEWLEYLTEEAENCLGLAAIQIGLPVRAFYLHLPGGEEPKRFRNPSLISRSDNKYVFRNEGCMSFPGRHLNTERHEWVEVADDINGTAVYKGLLGACVQHEMDHLDGILMFDRKGDLTFKRDKPKVGRNDPCPTCLEEGVRVKYKKCAKHFAG